MNLFSKQTLALALGTCLAAALSTPAAAQMTPLAGFTPIIGANVANARGLCVNPVTGNVLVAESTGPFVRIYNPNTGALIASMDVTGITGGGGGPHQGQGR